MTGIIVKKFEPHYNRALGMPIASEKQYKAEMARQGMCSKEQGDDIARNAREKREKPYKCNEDTMKFLHNVKSHAEKDGKVKLSGREIVYMEKLGVKFGKVDYKGTKGGFNAM